MSPRRLYLDNAATSFPKPRSVLDAMNRYAMELGASAGRGAYVEAVESGRLIETCRRRLNQLFNGGGANHFVFTLNCTEALNLAIKGLIDPRDGSNNRSHAICTAIDHNSILRPLARSPSADGSVKPRECRSMRKRGWSIRTTSAGQYGQRRNSSRSLTSATSPARCSRSVRSVRSRAAWDSVHR